MTMSNATRREILRRATALSCVGAAASTFGLQLATMGSASAQTATGYKALVCIFLLGGNDSNNMVFATDPGSWSRYFAARSQGSSPIALMPFGTPATPPGGTNQVTQRVLPAGNPAYAFPEAWGGVLPISTTTQQNFGARSFAINPNMGALLPLWNGGRLAVAANVGPLIVPTTKAQYRNRSVPLPTSLMSHNDQQSVWQSGSAEGARRGWGGLLADQMMASNGSNAVFTAISTSGNAVLLAGQTAVQYQMSINQTNPAVRISSALDNNMGARVREIIRDTSGSSYFMQDYGAKVIRSQDSADILNAQFAANGPGANIPAPTLVMNPVTRGMESNYLAVQLQTVAKVIAANQALGMKRQVFFVSVGGYDTHDIQTTNHAPLMARLAHAMAYFDGALANVGGGVDMRDKVTTFTASDFSRTFTTNGDGTDHAWGSHQFMMGGAVRGGDIYGRFPEVGVDGNGFDNPNMLNNVLIPTMSVDQYAGTMARWFGLSDAQIASIFPNITNFSNRYYDFMAAPVA